MSRREARVRRSKHNVVLEEMIDARERLLQGWSTSESELDEIYGDDPSFASSGPAPQVPSRSQQQIAGSTGACVAQPPATLSLCNYRLMYRHSVGKIHIDVRRLVSEIYVSMFRSLPEDHV